MGKRVVSGLTLLFLEEKQKHMENSDTISNGGGALIMLEKSVIGTAETKEDVKEENDHVIIRTTKLEMNAKSCFRMPLHYPLFTKEDYDNMPLWRLDQLFAEYGLKNIVGGDLNYKRKFAMAAFLWPRSRK
ncbi:hypothetical protein CCACVL1_19401 [Corchorus capsularis]|uniref:DUF7722 domain-containing protein n=1 Tax=Corchorus capsularis TaxID=210143 RepID=A0A1R3HGX2_COCAP|nr:hypothetical protein CCACVL1_19401 [Corchorus capsularis]